MAFPARAMLEFRLGGGRPGGDLARLLEAYEAELVRSKLADRAEVLRLALEAEHPLLSRPAALVDLPVSCAVEDRFLSRLSSAILATCPSGDERAAARLSRALGVAASALPEGEETSLARVQRHLFAQRTGPEQPLGDDVLVLSAPGESRECVEIARLVRREAERGVSFDRLAVLLRSAGQYRPLLDEALARAGLPAYFASGTVRPDPAGRAFLALLGRAAEGFSANRFAEYLSLGEVPDAAAQGAPPPAPAAGDRWVPPDAELIPQQLAEEEPAGPRESGAPVVAGTLRAPWRWEHLLLDAAVIKGRERWEKRLRGLEGQLRVQLQNFADDEARAQRLRRAPAQRDAPPALAPPASDAPAGPPQQPHPGDGRGPLATPG